VSFHGGSLEAFYFSSDEPSSFFSGWQVPDIGHPLQPQPQEQPPFLLLRIIEKVASPDITATTSSTMTVPRFSVSQATLLISFRYESFFGGITALFAVFE
jgi:hypothetical protein